MPQPKAESTLHGLATTAPPLASRPSNGQPPQAGPGRSRSHATACVPTTSEHVAAGAARAALIGEAFDCAEDLVVLRPDSSVAGLVAIEALLGASAATPVNALMDPDPPLVGPDDDEEAVAERMVARGESSLAVVDADGHFLGLIPPYRMLAVLLAEHEEDLARLGGYLAGTRRARSAAEESVKRRLWHRLPWLLLGLAGAMLSAALLAAFERELDARVLLAFFVPGIVYMADAVGTQTEAVLIRGLSVGVSMSKVVRRELLTGLIVGAAVGGAFFVFALLTWGDVEVATAVGVALVASCSIATVVAMLLPWWFQRAGADPAFGSGPLATVIQDLLSIAVYLVTATVVVG
jgi:magnesium transporter